RLARYGRAGEVQDVAVEDRRPACPRWRSHESTGLGACPPGTRHAAWPRITFPVFNSLAVGFHPLATLASSNSSAVGSWSQTETELTAPSHVTSKTSTDPSCAPKITSCVYSSWMTTSPGASGGSRRT